LILSYQAIRVVLIAIIIMKSTNLANAYRVYPQIAQLKARVHPQIWPQLLLSTDFPFVSYYQRNI